jgi:hypothetical protein
MELKLAPFGHAAKWHVGFVRFEQSDDSPVKQP